MNKLLVLLLLLISFATFAQSTYPKVEIPNSQIRKITSKIVANQEYELQILLPGNYENNNKTYPVVYVLDAQWDFPLVKSIYGQQYYDGFLPELIIVGITYGGNNPNYDSLRVRDFSPTKGNLPQAGGADMFLTFMNNELFPFIEKNYRADDHTRTLMGCSFGGLLTLHALFTWNGLFTNYIVASPALGWDSGSIFRFEEQYYKRDEKNNKKLYMTIGDVETGQEYFEKLDTLLTNRKYRSFVKVSKVLENTGHSGTKSETYNRGLQFAFERPKLNLSESILNKYVGKYADLKNNTVELFIENNQLKLKEGFTTYPLFAAGERDFYSTAEFLNIGFFSNNLAGFKMERFDSVMMFRKI